MVERGVHPKCVDASGLAASLQIRMRTFAQNWKAEARSRTSVSKRRMQTASQRIKDDGESEAEPCVSTYMAGRVLAQKNGVARQE